MGQGLPRPCCCCSVAKLFLTLCDPVDYCWTPGFPVPHFLLEFAQTHILWGFPGGDSGKEPACQFRRHTRCQFNPWVGKISWRRVWQYFSILAWRIPWTGEPGGLQCIGLRRVGYSWARTVTVTQMRKPVGAAHGLVTVGSRGRRMKGTGQSWEPWAPPPQRPLHLQGPWAPSLPWATCSGSLHSDPRGDVVKDRGCTNPSIFSSVQFSRSVVSDSATPWTAACQASLSISNSWNLFKLMSIESVMPSNHLIRCYPLLLLPSVFPRIKVFSNESVLCMR